jgi:hypothetical protein
MVTSGCRRSHANACNGQEQYFLPQDSVAGFAVSSQRRIVAAHSKAPQRP